LTPEEFVDAVRIQTSDAAVAGAIQQMEKPSGRRPREADVRLSGWYQGLSSSDRENLQEALKNAAESAIFGFFCILDGVRVFEYGRDKGDLELIYKKGDLRVLLNDPQKEELHNLYNGGTF
jgi:hypothetical protein